MKPTAAIRYQAGGLGFVRRTGGIRGKPLCLPLLHLRPAISGGLAVRRELFTLCRLELQPSAPLHWTGRAFHRGLSPLAGGTVLHGSVPSSAHSLIFQRTGGVRGVLCRLPLLGFFTVLPLAALPGGWRRGRVLAAGGSGHHGRVRRHPHGRSVRHGGFRDAGGGRGGIGRFLCRLLDGPGLFPPFLARGSGIAVTPLNRAVARRLFLGTGRTEGYIRRPLADALFLAGSHVLLHQTVPAQLLHRFRPGLEPFAAHRAASGVLCSLSGAGAGWAAASARFSANACRMEGFFSA